MEINMNINIPQMIVTLVNLLILFWIVKHFAFDRVNKILKDRKNLIEDTINKADEDLEKARVLKLQNQREIKSAREEGKTIVSQYKSKADSIYKEIVEDARKEASIIIEKSKVEIDRERNKAEDDIKNQVVDLAMTISEKVLGESIDMNKHKELIDEYISKVGM
ncbi:MULTISPECIES: F0F1 ATP synthase subunit B [Clostridium]|uniref:ATP synthase subunit b n=1 Tax=Clostridium nitritogenes TaxID=83340 RepID=A0ABN1LSX8_9CLOT|nr:F0F1 ATP synthase subunit B [Clostridium baratii]MBS6042624.1 F0F1 ATP synthase subunit B [Clostridium baratii]MBT9831740.1 F0F1 ATP synthase subunit B [Clostridium baratii]MDU1854920.1 F0F1 ATP synthase subunit B [Clostridium baratii]MDY3207477.1 F0F1 ATP synthase subunit B [Clostridium baratii]OPF52838.1 ATP F0F1 synthase subunit B [Clostridium baratii]